MATKLTLSLDSKIIEAAKKYSEKKGISLSKIVEEYLARITGPKIVSSKRSVKELRGIAGPVASDFDYKKAVRDHVFDKHFKQ